MDRTVLASPEAQRKLILLLLLMLAAACWALLLAGASISQSDMNMARPTMGVAAPLFVAMWIVMMVAMMFPAAAPMILTYHRIQSGRRDRRESFVSTWLFVGGYLAVWGSAGIA